MELEKQIDDLKISAKTAVVSFALVIPLIFFDAWILQIAWNEWMRGLTGIALTYVGYVGVMMFIKIIASSLTYIRGDEKVRTAKQSIIQSVGKRIGVLMIFGLFSLIWMILI